MTTPVGEGAQSGAEGTQSGAGVNTEPQGGTTGTNDDGTQSGVTNPAVGEAETLRQQLEQQRQRTLAADKRAGEIEAQLKQLRDKDLPEAEKLQRDFQESQKQVEVLTSRNNQLALENAFLKDNTYSWHNPDRALKLVDLSQVTIEEDGTVNGLRDALKALATSDAYLIKQEVKEESKPTPGTAPANNGGTGGRAPKSGSMATRIPALNSRPTRR